MKQKRDSNRGSMLVFVMMLIILLGAFGAALYQTSFTVYKGTGTLVDVKDARTNAEMGIGYLIRNFNERDLKDQSASKIESWLNSEIVRGKHPVNNPRGWFRLQSWIKTGETDYLLTLSGAATLSQPDLSRAPFSEFVEKTYAQASSREVVVHYQCLVGPRVRSLKGTSIISPRFQNDGNNNQVGSYPGSGRMLAKVGGKTLTTGSNVKTDSSTNHINTAMGDLTGGANQRTDSNWTAFTSAMVTGVTAPSSSQLSSESAMAAINGIQAVGTGGKTVLNIASGKWDFTAASTLSLASHATFGDVAQFAYMKFSKLEATSTDQILRFYPGIYVFEEFVLKNQKQTILMDTTTGPVTFIITKKFLIKDGNKNALIVFKDRTYGGGSDFGSYSRKIDEPNRYKVFPALPSTYPNLSPITPELGGRKLAQIIFRSAPLSTQTEFEVIGNMSLIGGLAVGAGGDLIEGIPSVTSGQTFDDVSDGTGTEAMHPAGGGWDVYVNATSNPPSPTTEHFYVWANGKHKFTLRSNSNTEPANFVGGYIAPYSSGSNQGEGTLDGNNLKFFGMAAFTDITVKKNNFIFSMDSRQNPLPPVRLKGTFYVKFQKRID